MTSPPEDLSPEAVRSALPGRQARVYPALLSTEADAMAWARAGAPQGSVVVADYQASARGRGGLEWRVRPGLDLGFSVVMRPGLPAAREGWLYTVATSGLADLLGATIEWPDEVHVEGSIRGAVGTQTELGPTGVEWGVITALITDAERPRAALLARAVEAIERRATMSAERVVADYLPRCRTIGRRVTARLIPMGPSGPRVTGRAAATVVDGALILETDQGRRVGVPPQNLGMLEDAEGS